MVKGWTPVILNNTLVERLVLMYGADKNRPQTQKLSPWIADLLNKYADFFESMQRYGPFLEFIGTRDDYILIEDHRGKRKETIHVYVKNDKKQLECEKHGRTDCLHVGFCFAIPEVYKVLIENGFKQPKS